MAKRQRPVEPSIEHVRDEAVYIPKGDTTYTVDLDQSTVDDLALGICPEALSRRMFELVRWRRDALRQDTRRTAEKTGGA